MHQCDGGHGSPNMPCGGGHEGPLKPPVPGEQTYWHSWGHVVSDDMVRWKRGRSNPSLATDNLLENSDGVL